VTALAGGGGLVSAGLGAVDPPPVQPAVVAAATNRTTHRRTDVTFAPYRRSPGQRGQEPVDRLVVAVCPARSASLAVQSVQAAHEVRGHP
jgi:hypothetical protein